MSDGKDTNLNNIKENLIKRLGRYFLKRSYAIGVILLFGLFVFQLWFHAVRTSVTIDEVPHILAGYRHLQCGDFGINPEHPPLLKMVAAAPLMSQDLVQPDWKCGSKLTEKFDSWYAGYSFLTKNDPDSIVIPARLAASLMSLLLIVLVALAAREMFGRIEAVIAILVFAFEPNLIAHGALVTTDMAVSAGLFAAVFTFYRFRKNPSLVRFLLVGLCVGWTLCSKHSGIIVLPMLFLLLITDIFLFSKLESGKKLFSHAFRHLMAFAGICLIAYVLLWASYGFRYHPLPDQTEKAISTDDFFRQLKMSKVIGTKSGETIKFISETHLLPEAYTLGLADVVATNSRLMFLFGEVSPTGRWFYFPAAFSIKTSVALLALFPLGLITIGLYRTCGREMVFLLVPALIYFAVGMNSGINIGIRHILPVYAFFIIIAAAGACSAGRKSKRDCYGLILLLIFHAVTAARTAPNYLAFSNDMWGGPNNTYKYLTDSNVDWGQNVKLVNEYLERENIKDCWFANFGSGDIARTQQPCRLLPGGFGWNFSEQPIDAVPPVIEGTILISTGVSPPYRNTAEYVAITQDATPIAQIGGTVFVYRGRFEVPLAALSSHIERCDQLVQLKRFEEAIADGRKAVELGPDSIRAHFSLGIALAKTKQIEAARAEFDTAIQIALSNSNKESAQDLEIQAENELSQVQ